MPDTPSPHVPPAHVPPPRVCLDPGSAALAHNNDLARPLRPHRHPSCERRFRLEQPLIVATGPKAATA